MDLNVVDNIGKGNYDSKSVQSRMVSPGKLPTFKTIRPNLDEQVAQLDEMVYGDYHETVSTDGQTYVPKNADQLMDIMTKPLTMESISDSKLPEAIKRSIISNPLIEQPIEDPRMNELTEKLAKGIPGIQKSMQILNDLEKKDAEKRELNEEKIIRPNQSVSDIDYGMIKTIVESVVDEKLSQFIPTLTESVNQKCGSLSVMNIRNNKFLFLDDNDNIFECQMVFKGKNKAKRKK